MSGLRAEVPELARSCLILHPGAMAAREMKLETEQIPVKADAGIAHRFPV
jgi:hypothetical protein